jgi:hypothetical protein
MPIGISMPHQSSTSLRSSRLSDMTLKTPDVYGISCLCTSGTVHVRLRRDERAPTTHPMTYVSLLWLNTDERGPSRPGVKHRHSGQHIRTHESCHQGSDRHWRPSHEREQGGQLPTVTCHSYGEVTRAGSHRGHGAPLCLWLSPSGCSRRLSQYFAVHCFPHH